MRKKILERSLIFGIIIMFLLTAFPNSLGFDVVYYKEKPVKNGDIEFNVWGFIAFFVKVTNNRDEEVRAYVNFSMEFFDLGAKSIIKSFPVRPHSSALIFWDCQPMPIYFTTITISAGGENYTKNGFTILGFNIFYN